MNAVISTPTLQEELQMRGASRMTEGQALLDLARSLGKFEDATGQRLAVVDAGLVRFAEPVAQDQDSADAGMAEVDLEIELDIDPVLTGLDEPVAPVADNPAPPVAPAPVPVPAPDPEPELAHEPEAVTRLREELTSTKESLAKVMVAEEVVAGLIARDAQAEAAAAPAPTQAAADPAPKAGLPWSDDEKAKAVSLKRKGFSASHIAKVLGRPMFATRHMMTKLSKEAGTAPPKPGSAKAAPPVPAGPDAPDPEPQKAPPSAASAPPTPAVPPVPPPIAPAPTAPISAAPEKPLTTRQRIILEHLSRLDDTFEPEDDLYLVEQLAKGVPSNVIADQLGCDCRDLGIRYRKMLCDEIKTQRGDITIDGQEDLLTVLRWRSAQ